MSFNVIDEFDTVYDYLKYAEPGDRIYLTYLKSVPGTANINDTYKVDEIDLKKNILYCSSYYKHKVYRIIGKMLNQRVFLVKSLVNRNKRNLDESIGNAPTSVYKYITDVFENGDTDDLIDIIIDTIDSISTSSVNETELQELIFTVTDFKKTLDSKLKTVLSDMNEYASVLAASDLTTLERG